VNTIVYGGLSTAITLAALDPVCLSLVANGFCRSQMGALRAETVDLVAATLFYIIMVTGILIFAVLPAVRSADAWQALGAGAFFGLVCYAAYDLTNLATLRGWPVALTLVDMAWVSILTALAALAGFGAARAAAG
jgi:uncharacterized membrane protein